MTGEVRHALRRLRATPVVTLSAVACLAIGVWMICLLSAVGRGVFRPDLGIAAPDRLVSLDESGLYREEGSRQCCRRLASRGVVDTLRARKTFAAIGFYSAGNYGIADDPSVRHMTVLSSGMMDVLHLRVAIGRGFIPADDSVPAVILSGQLWRTMFGADPAVIGRRLRLRGETIGFPIVGVLPDAFMFPQNDLRSDFYVSMGLRGSRDYPQRTVLARLHDGQDVADARSAVREVATRSIAADRDAYVSYARAHYKRTKIPTLLPGPVTVRLDRYYNEPIPPEFVSFTLLVMGCGLAVVLVAAANVANLLLVRGAARRQEIAVRMALGASRSSIVYQLVTETAILAVVGVAIGFLIAFWQWQLIDAAFQGRQFLGTIDVATAWYAMAGGLGLTAVVGIWPGLRTTAMNLEQVLRDTRRAGVGATPLDGLLGRLVAASTAATVMLLICAVLLGLSARDASNEKTIPERNVLKSTVAFDERESRAVRTQTVRVALAGLRRLPGVEAAAVGNAPGDGESLDLIAEVSGGPEKRLGTVDVYDVSDGYFDGFRVPMVEGRSFSAQDTRDSSDAAIVSRSVATVLFGAGPAVGHRFRYHRPQDSVSTEATVVGVARNVGGGGWDRYQIYRPYGARAPSQFPVLVRYARGAEPQPGAIAGVLRSLPGLLASEPETLDRGSQTLKFRRYVQMGFTLFATIGLILAGIGTYGIVAYSVVRRTHEIGVRMALGADRAAVTRMIVAQGLKITLLGVIGGVVLSFITTKAIASALMDVNTDYPLAMLGVIMLVTAVSMIASWIPGYRAGRLNPVDALRAE
jgi:putative ABC transport system permease protein